MHSMVGKKRLGFNPVYTALAVLLAVSSTSVHAGKITSIPSTTHDAATFSGVQHGFGGWNLDNVVVNLNGTFDEATGAYNFNDDSVLSYFSAVDDGLGNVLGRVLAKDWPVGEPAGIKIVNDDFDVKEGRPTNCIMSTSYLDDHFLDTAEPIAVTCSGPFQSHKRYKLAMLPSTVTDDSVDNEKGIDLVFNVEADGTSRDYQVFQKINNWTDLRLAGFTIQVGTGLGASFVPASDATSGVGVTNLSVSVPSDVWREDQLAVFSQGLFGPVDTRHGRPAGFFDPTTRAGFTIAEYGAGNTADASGQTDTLTSGATLGSDYADVPAGAGTAANQFGSWLPNTMLPYGIFYDDDANPDTDDQLVAWYGYSPAASGLHWMKGAADNFELVADATITGIWSNDPLYSMGEIDDLVNIGLNYRVTVGDISGFPGFNTDPILNAASFTIRITPKVAAVQTPPTYVGQSPSPALGDPHGSSDATITLTPTVFVTGTGETLTVTLSDGDLNTNTGVAETASMVDVSTSDGSVATVTGITVTETGVNTGVFTATLPAQFSDAAAGVDVIVTYTDADDGNGGVNVVKTASSTALAAPPAYGTIQFNPLAYTVNEEDGTVELTVTRTGGTDGEVSVAYQTISGTAIGNQDYIPDTETLVTFADGDAADKTITIELIDDILKESSAESFTVLLSNTEGGATLGSDDTATVTINADADTVVYGSILFDPAAYTVAEDDGTVELTVTRTDSTSAVTVAYQVISGTAVAGEDYVADTANIEGTITFADGSASETITVDLINDTAHESDETFTVQLSDPLSGRPLADDDTATVTVTDTDPVDTDGDGIPDIQDAFPDDPDSSVSTYGRTSGSVGLLTLFVLGMVGLLARRKV